MHVEIPGEIAIRMEQGFCNIEWIGVGRILELFPVDDSKDRDGEAFCLSFACECRALSRRGLFVGPPD
jgi:hypothetical protein